MVKRNKFEESPFWGVLWRLTIKWNYKFEMKYINFTTTILQKYFRVLFPTQVRVVRFYINCFLPHLPPPPFLLLLSSSPHRPLRPPRRPCRPRRFYRSCRFRYFYLITTRDLSRKVAPEGLPYLEFYFTKRAASPVT